LSAVTALTAVVEGNFTAAFGVSTLAQRLHFLHGPLRDLAGDSAGARIRVRPINICAGRAIPNVGHDDAQASPWRAGSKSRYNNIQ
jgi:hypothetical protein